MIRRNVEEETQFASEVEKTCGGHSMQGFLRDNNGPTAFVEAFEKENPTETLNDAFGNDTTFELYCRAKFAEQANLPFYVFIYDGFVNDINRITKYRIGVADNHSFCIYDEESMSEEDVIEWWQNNTYHIANPRPYRPQMIERLRNSRFDRILEGDQITCENHVKWGQNIDWFIMSEDGENVVAIVENRIASADARHNSVDDYDPVRHATAINGSDNGDKDYYSFRNLNGLKNSMNIPLYLATYSRLLAESHKVGICEIYGVRKRDKRIFYKNEGNVRRPSDNVFDNAETLNAWLREREEQRNTEDGQEDNG